MTMTDEEKEVVNHTNVGQLAAAGKTAMEDLAEKQAGEFFRSTGKVTMQVRLRHSLQFVLKKGFTASVTRSYLCAQTCHNFDVR